jgi:ribosomal protein S21
MKKVDLNRTDLSADKLLGSFSPVEVKLSQSGGNFEKMVKKFSKKVKKYGIMEELRERSFHKTKSQKVRIAKMKAVRLQKKESLQDEK